MGSDDELDNVEQPMIVDYVEEVEEPEEEDVSYEPPAQKARTEGVVVDGEM